ncbi:Uncharacterised protein [Mycobacterium tuberculosis]|nr:Uncharacterised protein [Mycobacterium tuberculosis]
MGRIAQFGGLLDRWRWWGRTRPRQVAGFGRVWVVGDGAEDVGPVRGPHDRTNLSRWPTERGLAAGGQQQNLVTDVQVGQ